MPTCSNSSHGEKSQAKVKAASMLYVLPLCPPTASAVFVSHHIKVLRRVALFPTSTSLPMLRQFLPEPTPSRTLTLALTALELLFVQGTTEPCWETKWSVITSLLPQSLSITGHHRSPFWLALRRPLLTISSASCLLVSLCCFPLILQTSPRQKHPGTQSSDALLKTR